MTIRVNAEGTSYLFDDEQKGRIVGLKQPDGREDRFLFTSDGDGTLDPDLVTWALITRAGGFDTFVTEPSSVNLRTLMTDETGTGVLVFSDSPALTGTPTAPTAAGGTNTTQLATTAFVTSAISTAGATYQPLTANGTSWAAVTRAAGFDAFVANPTSANLAALVTNETGVAGFLVFSDSPNLTGTPTAPTAAGGTNNTQLATTAFVTAAIASASGSYQPSDSDLSSWALITRASGFDAFVATPSSANLRALLTDETGTGAAVFATSPTLVTPALGTPSAVVLTNGTGLPIATGVSGLAAGIATFLATPTSANLLAAVTNETGTGALVFATSPALVTPALGTPTSGVLTNCTGLPVASGISGLAAGIATFLATPTSANLLAAVTNETGTGLLVFATSPSLTTPAIAGATLSGTLSGTPTVASAWTWSSAQLFPTVEIGNADTTLSRSAASVLAVEGKNVVTNGSNSSLATSISTVGSVPAWSDYEGGGYATTNITAPLMFSSKYGRGASATDAVDVRFVRWANYTGGTAYTTNTNLAVSTMAGAGGLTFEWAGLFTLDSYRTAADGTQDVGIYIQSIKNSTGGVWCLATELQDKGGANPTVGTVNVELAGSSLGADNNNQRLFLHIIPSSRDGSMTEWGRGITFSTGALAKIKSAVYFDGTNYDYIIDYSKFQISGVGSITALGPTHVFGTTGADTIIRQATTDRNLAINGGNTITDGAGIQLFGSTHASFPGNGGLYSGATTVFAWNSTIVNLPLGTASRLLALDASKNIVQTITSANLAASVSDETGTGLLVFATSPSLTTPSIAGMTLSGTITGAVTATTAGTAGRFTNTTDTGSNVALIIEHDRATPTANDVLIMDWRMSDSAGNQDIFGRFDLVASNVTNTTEASYFRMATMVAGSLTGILRFTNTAFRSETNDQMALGTATVSFADLFLASGGVVNFNNGDVLITHSANTLAFTGASTGYTFDAPVTVSGAFTSLGIDDNATGERLQIADTLLTLGTSGAAYGVTHSVNDQSLVISGGNTTTAGANIVLTGGTAGLPNIGALYAGSTRSLAWASTVVIFDRPAALPVYTFATLPGSPSAGWTAFISDCLTNTYGAAAAGGGANQVPVYYDGAIWRIG